jgi:uncharacterized protein YbjT (DUF2867 family)
MRILVIGGTGRIGARVVAKLAEIGHDAISASRRSGVDVYTGDGLARVFVGVNVVVDVSEASDFDDDPVMDFFTNATRNLLAAAQVVGVERYVALSIVGAHRSPDSGYLRAKVAQEALIRESGVRYRIVQATPFYEFVEGLADSAMDGDVVKLPPALVQPMAADDAATAIAQAAVVVGDSDVTTEVAGPQQFGMDDFVRTGLAALGDPRQVLTDVSAPYFGALIDDESTIPGPGADIYNTRFADWLSVNAASGTG